MYERSLLIMHYFCLTPNHHSQFSKYFRFGFKEIWRNRKCMTFTLVILSTNQKLAENSPGMIKHGLSHIVFIHLVVSNISYGTFLPMIPVGSVIFSIFPTRVEGARKFNRSRYVRISNWKSSIGWSSNILY